jgi:YVTN family beta-propeller protein
MLDTTQPRWEDAAQGGAADGAPRELGEPSGVHDGASAAVLGLLAVLLVLSDLSAPRSEAAQATPPPQATAQRGAGRAGLSPTVLGDINGDGIVDIRDYGVWRQQFGATDCGNAADINGDCLVDIRDYGIWRAQFGLTGPTPTPLPPATVTPTATATTTTTATPTITPTLSGRAYVANAGSSNVTVLDTMTNTVVGPPILVGANPGPVGVDPTVHRAYVGNTGSSNVTVIDTTTNTVVGTPIPVSNYPADVAVDPTVHRAYVTNSGSNAVSVVDTTNTAVGTPVPVGSAPIGVGIGP